MDKSDLIPIISISSIFLGIIGGGIASSIISSDQVKKMENALGVDANLERLDLEAMQYYVANPQEVEGAKTPFFVTFYSEQTDSKDQYKITYNVDEETYNKLVKKYRDSSDEVERFDYPGDNKILIEIINNNDPLSIARKTYETISESKSSVNGQVIEYNLATGTTNNYELNSDPDFQKYYASERG